MEDIPQINELFDIIPQGGRNGKSIYELRIRGNSYIYLTPNQIRMILNVYKTQIENQLLSLGDGIGDY